MKQLFSLFLLVTFFSVNAQKVECYKINKEVVKSIDENVRYLSSDEMEGRAPGTAGAEMARDFIAKMFERANLIPMGESSTYFQKFMVPEPAEIDAEKTQLIQGKNALKLKTQFYPLVYSANGTVTAKTQWVNFGITAPELKYDDYKKVKSLEGKIVVMDVSSPDGIHPHSAYTKYHDLSGRLALAKSKGAVGAILVNLGDMAENPEELYRKIRSVKMPVVFVNDVDAAKKFKKSKETTLSVSQREKNADAYNVVGFVDNNKPTTVVIGAHYDHLGYGENGSLYVGAPAIHNGADDNASGTAALIALAEDLGKHEDLTGHNYLFIAFTAEERGLLGSNYFVNNPTFPIEEMAYMINMDMVGRLRDNQLQISGTGTASEWRQIEETLACHDLVLKLDPSGVGPSDHTSFYNMQMPVLHFFTGSHEDYHKPSDDADKVNYEGIGIVVGAIKNVLASVDKNERLEYVKTKDENARKAPKFSVTLGIMPNYMYEEGGVKVDGVSPEKPAAVAGLLKDDIIIQLGDFAIEDMYGYMNALAAFKKGDEARIVFLRNGKKVESKVKF